MANTIKCSSLDLENLHVLLHVRSFLIGGIVIGPTKASSLLWSQVLPSTL